LRLREPDKDKKKKSGGDRISTDRRAKLKSRRGGKGRKKTNGRANGCSELRPKRERSTRFSEQCQQRKYEEVRKKSKKTQGSALDQKSRI